MSPTISIVTVSCEGEYDVFAFETPEGASAFFSEKIEEQCNDLDSKTVSETIKLSLRDCEFTWPDDSDIDGENVLKIFHNVPFLSASVTGN